MNSPARCTAVDSIRKITTNVPHLNIVQNKSGGSGGAGAAALRSASMYRTVGAGAAALRSASMYSRCRQVQHTAVGLCLYVNLKSLLKCNN